MRKLGCLILLATSFFCWQSSEIKAFAEIISPEGFSKLIPDNVKETSSNTYGSKAHIVGTDIHVTINNFGDIADMDGKIIGKTSVDQAKIAGEPILDLSKLARIKSVVDINVAGEITDSSGTIIGRTMDTLAQIRATASRKKISIAANAIINPDGKIVNESTGKILGQTLPGLINKSSTKGSDPHKLTSQVLSIRISNSGYISEYHSGRIIGTILGAEE